jgi:hypothetical protein
MTTDIEKVKAYAEELERLIEAVDIHPHQRILINSLIGMAKEKYNMYPND